MRHPEPLDIAQDLRLREESRFRMYVPLYPDNEILRRGVYAERSRSTPQNDIYRS